MSLQIIRHIMADRYPKTNFDITEDSNDEKATALFDYKDTIDAITVCEIANNEKETTYHVILVDDTEVWKIKRGHIIREI